jgi:hypothetical protein
MHSAALRDETVADMRSHSSPRSGVFISSKTSSLGGFWWHPANPGKGHFGGAWDGLRVEGLVELERKIKCSLGISFACQFFGDDLPRSIGFVITILHVSPYGPHVRPNSEQYTDQLGFRNSPLRKS